MDIHATALGGDAAHGRSSEGGLLRGRKSVSKLPRFIAAQACFGLLLSCLSAGTARAQFTLSNTPLWTAAPGDPRYSFLSTDNTQRGIAFNPATGNLIVASRFGGPGNSNLGVHVLNGQTGELIGQLNVLNITGGNPTNFPGNLVGVGDDGAIYLGNLTTASAGTPFRLYRWASESAGLNTVDNQPAVNVYSGDPTNGAGGARFGDSLDVQGSGINTQVLVGARAGTPTSFAAILKPADATAAVFTATTITTDVDTGHLGLAFQDADTYWTKNNVAGTNGLLRQVNITGTSGTTANGPPAGFPPAAGPLGVDGSKNLLALLEVATATSPDNSVQLYDISTPASPTLITSRPLAAANQNANGTGAVDFGNDVLYALESNNGIVAYRVVPEPSCLGVAALAALALLRPRLTP